MRFSVYQVSRKGGREKNEDRMGYCYTRDAGLFALQKELSREGERRYTKLSVGEKMRLQFDNMVTDTKKSMKKTGFGPGVKAK